MDLQSTWDQELKHEFRLKVKKLTNQIVALRVEEAEAKQQWKEKRTERKAALRELEAHLLAAARDASKPVKVKPLTIAGKLFVVISAESDDRGRAWNLRPLYPFADFEIDYVHIPTRHRPGVLNCTTCEEDWWAGVCVKVKGVKGELAIGPKLEQRRLIEAEEPAHAS